MLRRLLIVLLAISLTVALGFYSLKSSSVPKSPAPSQSPSPTIPSHAADVPQTSTMVTGLDVPWELVFLPDHSLLVTERPGRIRVISKSWQLLPTPLATIPDVYQNGEGGLLGMTLDPQFATNHYFYLYYTYGSAGTNTLNRVVRYTLENNTLSHRTVLIDAIPGAVYHDGGRIKFGPDGYLYVTTGDANQPSLAQDKNALAGKILRVTRDGQPAPGNPFNTRIYSYGHRNSQGLAWDDQGNLYATEHGRSSPLSGFDELNLIQPGKNYGWPIIQGSETRPGMVTPLINSGPTTTWAPSGMVFYNGSLYFAGLRGQSLYKATVHGDSVDLKTYLTGEFGRLRDVVVGPDNMLYILTNNRDGRGTPREGDDKIIRINPAKL